MTPPLRFAVYSHDPRLDRPYLVKRFPTMLAAAIFIANSKPRDRAHLRVTREADNAPA